MTQPWQERRAEYLEETGHRERIPAADWREACRLAAIQELNICTKGQQNGEYRAAGMRAARILAANGPGALPNTFRQLVAWFLSPELQKLAIPRSRGGKVSLDRSR